MATAEAAAVAAVVAKVSRGGGEDTTACSHTPVCTRGGERKERVGLSVAAALSLATVGREQAGYGLGSSALLPLATQRNREVPYKEECLDAVPMYHDAVPLYLGAVPLQREVTREGEVRRLQQAFYKD